MYAVHDPETFAETIACVERVRAWAPAVPVVLVGNQTDRLDAHTERVHYSVILAAMARLQICAHVQTTVTDYSSFAGVLERLALCSQHYSETSSRERARQAAARRRRGQGVCAPCAGHAPTCHGTHGSCLCM